MSDKEIIETLTKMKCRFFDGLKLRTQTETTDKEIVAYLKQCCNEMERFLSDHGV